ncbi:MAG: hypothetical protein P1U57_05060 [Oleibacter sp.]|nr:hypothetical protein [Thalassolituus sp.]
MIELQNQSSLKGIKKYCDLLEELKLRVKTVQDIVNKNVPISSFGEKSFADEFIFLQIRKILELIAFGSMASNIVEYEKLYSDYKNNWRAKKIIERLERVNKDFYPVPLQQTSAGAPLENVRSGFLTKDDFVFLYDVCSKVIHSKNPYSEIHKIDIKMSVDDWMHRIASLLWFHQIKLVDSEASWLVYLMHPETNKSHAIMAKKY